MKVVGSYKVFIPPLILIGWLLLGWESAVRIWEIPSYIMPTPSGVVAICISESALLFSQNLYTLTEALLGLILGSSVAFGVGVIASRYMFVERAVMPVAILVKVTPILAIAPLFAIWFGFGLLPKVFIVSVVTFFPVLINTILGLRSVDAPSMLVFRTMGVSEFEILIHLRIPYSLPYLFSALKISLPLSIIGAVVGEWFSSDKGLGSLIMVAHGNLDTHMLFGAIFYLAFTGILLMAGLSLLEKKFMFWHSSTKTY